jgi:segregation and condensation protein B
MSNLELEHSIEAILMVIDEPVTEETLAKVLDRSSEEIASALVTLVSSYEQNGFELRQISGGWRILSSGRTLCS